MCRTTAEKKIVKRKHVRKIIDIFPALTSGSGVLYIWVTPFLCVDKSCGIHITFALEVFHIFWGRWKIQVNANNFILVLFPINVQSFLIRKVV